MRRLEKEAGNPETDSLVPIASRKRDQLLVFDKMTRVFEGE